MTVIVDNLAGGDCLGPAWGFACLLQTPEGPFLFDTGPDGGLLEKNMACLQIDPLSIHQVFLSHAHWDHVGGLPKLLRLRRHYAGDELPPMKVWIPEGFSESVADKIRAQGGDCRVLSASTPIQPGLRSSGSFAEGMPEHGLVLDCIEGPLLITGCAHPGIVNMIRRVGQGVLGPVRWVLGGFHLMDQEGDRVQAVIRELEDLELARLGPAHCTGLAAQAAFAKAFGERCDDIRCGSRFSFTLNTDGGSHG